MALFLFRNFNSSNLPSKKRTKLDGLLWALDHEGLTWNGNCAWSSRNYGTTFGTWYMLFLFRNMFKLPSLKPKFPFQAKTLRPWLPLLYKPMNKKLRAKLRRSGKGMVIKKNALMEQFLCKVLRLRFCGLKKIYLVTTYAAYMT